MDIILKLNKLIVWGQHFLNNQIDILRNNDAFRAANNHMLENHSDAYNIRLDYFSWKKDVIAQIKKLIPEKEAYVRGLFEKFEEDYDYYLITDLNGILTTLKENQQVEKSDSVGKKNNQLIGDNSKVFIVHGHSQMTISQTEAFLRKLDLEPVILRDQVNLGQTIIEKLEKNTDVAFAIVLYTACDFGCTKEDKGKEDKLRPRARQNVVFEHGYLNAKLGRDKVCALVEEGVEIPSDLAGVVYITIDKNGAWKTIVAKEMQIAGLNVDMNNL